VDVHHITPWEQCKKHEYANLIALCPNCHSRADGGDIDRKSLRMYKANLRFAVEKYSQFEIDVLFEFASLSAEDSIPYIAFPRYLRLLIKRILDAGFVETLSMPGDSAQDGRGLAPDPYIIALLITNAGKEFVKSLGSEDIGY